MRRILTVTAALLLVLSCALSAAETPEMYEGMNVEEIVYGEMTGHYGEEKEYALDLVTPLEGEGPYPVAFFLHGGGFSSENDKRQAYIPRFAKELTDAGWAMVSPDYPVYNNRQDSAGNYTPGAILAAEAVQLAYEYLEENAEELGLDMSRVVLLGGSAGGMAGFYAVAAHPEQYKAFINLWGAPEDVPDLSSFPPTLSVHGTADATVPFERELGIQDELESYGIRHDLVVLEGAGHTPIGQMSIYMPVVFEYLGSI